ncbi:Suppressor/enhancer of lin-12 protein 9 [Orchesella cincta]|uniref:Suppressor/enhancer of lin-12 protein 9 n=1 Tax=Orchesella cincta TaxID=48709 RepID=A0A1D2NM62_ORCCI|nr:Suppressor/enhancer of lin-12 protein 9 [Orchesella cincta]
MKSFQGGALLLVLLSLMAIDPCNSYRVMVDAYAEECFFDRVDTGTKMGLTFEVIEGGFMDIDLRITGPDGEELISRERESNGKVVFAAARSGVYTYCFSNKMSTVTPKEVMFTVNVGELHKPITEYGNYTVEETAAIEPEKFEKMISELKQSILSVKHEQDYMEVRDRIHRRINESTNFRVVMWAVFGSVLVLAMTVSQILYIKRFFEVRRMV